MPKGVYDRRHLGPCSAQDAERRRRALARRKALGLPIGRPVVRVLRSSSCVQCGAEFEYRHRPEWKNVRRFCSRRCFLASGEARRKLYFTKAALNDLYWTKQMSTVEIAAEIGISHKSVLRWMIQLGVPRRPIGPRKLKTCRIDGCGRPVHRVRHPTNGVLYGRLCIDHWIERRRAYAARARRKNAPST